MIMTVTDRLDDFGSCIFLCDDDPIHPEAQYKFYVAFLRANLHIIIQLSEDRADMLQYAILLDQQNNLLF